MNRDKQEMNVKIAAVITAAGSSKRMGGIKKEYAALSVQNDGTAGKPLTVLGSALSAFVASPRVDLIVITVPPGGEAEAMEALPRSGGKIIFAEGGNTRQASVCNALSLLEQYNPAWVLIHDGARPWIKPELIEKIIDAVAVHKAVIPLLPLIETPKEGDFSGIDGTGFILRHLRRSRVGSAQTPQAFSFGEILEAHKKARERDTEYTDDAEIWGEFIGPVAVIPGDAENRKITFAVDLNSQSTGGVNRSC